MKTRKEYIEANVTDLVSSFLYYDRKEDDDLPRGEIELAIETGEITADEIIELFKAELTKGLEN